MELDVLVRGGVVVFPGRRVAAVDIGISDGRISAIGNHLSALARTVIDASGKHVLPGIIDSHFHLGIFRPLAVDAETETASAIAGGVTTVLPYHRAGRNNLFEDVSPALPPDYSGIFRALLAEADGHFWCDYGFNLAPVTAEHIGEVPALVADGGVTTFKYYMHYRGIDPAHARPIPGEKEYVFSDTGYDLGHLYDLMTSVADANRTGAGGRVSVHAEHPGIIKAGTRRIVADSTLGTASPLQAYSRSRPPFAERLGILSVAELARQTGCPVNILHVSSALALDAIREARRRYPEIDILAETTVHHLSLASEELSGTDGKVNPPIRSADDREALWRGVIAGDVQTVVSDHAAIDRAHKNADIWKAWYGFGGTELLLPAVITEGHVRRGISLERIAELLSSAPARYHGLSGRKGDIEVGMDADLAICDLTRKTKVDHRKLHSAQDFSPFDGRELTGWVETTLLRGSVVYREGAPVGGPHGQYIRRPS